MNFILFATLILLGASLLLGLGISAFFQKVEDTHMELNDEYDELFAG